MGHPPSGRDWRRSRHKRTYGLGRLGRGGQKPTATALTNRARSVRVPSSLRLTLSALKVPMKILFVHPGPLLYTNVFLRLEPLGLELVAEAARRAKHAVRLLDLQVESHADYHRMIAEWQPDFIAFSCNYLANVPEIVDLAKAAKRRLPRSFICVGGHSASFTAQAI